MLVVGRVGDLVEPWEGDTGLRGEPTVAESMRDAGRGRSRKRGELDHGRAGGMQRTTGAERVVAPTRDVLEGGRNGHQSGPEAQETWVFRGGLLR